MLNYLPDNISLELVKSKCIGCGLCAIVCPHQLFIIEDAKASITEKALCIECGACQSNCPVGALSVNAGTGCAVAVLKSKK